MSARFYDNLTVEMVRALAAIDAKVELAAERFEERMDGVDKRLGAIEARLDRIDARFDRLEELLRGRG